MRGRNAADGTTLTFGELCHLADSSRTRSDFKAALRLSGYRQHFRDGELETLHKLLARHHQEQEGEEDEEEAEAEDRVLAPNKTAVVPRAGHAGNPPIMDGLDEAFAQPTP
jgi:hypothetical protein